jgi:hypothetical protein
MKWYKKANDIDKLFNFKDKPMRERFRVEPQGTKLDSSVVKFVNNSLAKIADAGYSVPVGGGSMKFSHEDATKLAGMVLQFLKDRDCTNWPYAVQDDLDGFAKIGKMLLEFNIQSGSGLCVAVLGIIDDLIRHGKFRDGKLHYDGAMVG